MNTRARVTALPVMVAASLGLGGISTLGKVMAQSTPVAGGQMPTGFPELALTVEESGVTGMPESIEAGRYLVKVTGPQTTEMEAGGAIFVQFPEGLTAEAAYEEVMAKPNELPGFYLDTYFGGGVTLNQGTESWAVLDFTPGTWVVTTIYGSTLGIEFEVTGEMPAELPDPVANVTLDLLEMVIRVSAGEFAAGENLVTVQNPGAQIHFVDVSMVPDGSTKEQVAALIDSFMTGTPPAEGGLQEDDFTPVTFTNEQSPGVSQTVPMTLEPGTYFLSCWVPDPETFTPHAMMGMWDLVVIK